MCVEYDFSEVRKQYENNNSRELNGIAYDNESSFFWVTGKNWSNYYLVDLQISPEICQLSESEIEKIVIETINKISAQGMKDMGKVMGVLSGKLAGKADGKTISSIVRQKLL